VIRIGRMESFGERRRTGIQEILGGEVVEGRSVIG
jgi:hypothetical protein